MGAREPRLSNEVISAWSVVKPFIVLAAKFLGPGPLRLKLVKLAHELDESDTPSAAA